MKPIIDGEIGERYSLSMKKILFPIILLSLFSGISYLLISKHILNISLDLNKILPGNNPQTTEKELTPISKTNTEKTQTDTQSDKNSGVGNTNISTSDDDVENEKNDGKGNSSVPEGWKTYINEKYGFSMSYPTPYKALDDQNNLSGWDNGIVLFYNGGQAYDIIVQVWDNANTANSKYPGYKVNVYKVGNKYITVFNATDEPDNQGIIDTFTKL